MKAKSVRSIHICGKPCRIWGIHTGGGSDAPVESFNVLENIFCAVTRQRIHSENHECHCPQECLDIKDAVALFTSKAAYLTF